MSNSLYKTFIITIREYLDFLKIKTSGNIYNIIYRRFICLLAKHKKVGNLTQRNKTFYVGNHSVTVPAARRLMVYLFIAFS